MVERLESILIVDDDKIFQDLIETLLKFSGFINVYRAGCIKEVEKLIELRPDLVIGIVDLLLCNGDSGEVAAQMLRAKYPKIGIIGVSGLSEPKHGDINIEKGGNIVPILLPAIETLLQRQR